MNDNWIEIPFTEILDIQGGTQPPKSEFLSEKANGYVRLLQIRDFGNKPMPTYIIDKKTLKKCDDDDILIARYGASIGRILTGMTGAYNVAIAKVIIPKSVSKRYIYHLLNSPIFQIPIHNIQRSAQNGFNKEDLEKIKIPLAPVNEQKKIALLLDNILEKLDKNKQRLNKLPLIIKDFRQIVLKSAINGDLTKKWREKNIFSFSNELLNFPTNEIGWKIITAQDACEKVSSGSTPINNPFTQTGEIPFLKVYNIQNQQIAFDYKPQFITCEIHKKKLTRSIVKPNDVLMNIVGPPLGKIALVTDQYPEWNINQAIVFFRPKKYLLPKYLYYVLCEGREIENISLELKGSAGQQNISLTQSRNFVFDIPSIEEQELIVSKIDALFDLAKSIDEKYDQVKAKIDKLPESILEKAFRGDLVEQDENDEPAEKLLERILDERKKILKAKKK